MRLFKYCLILIYSTSSYSISIQEAKQLEQKTIRDPKVIYHYTKLSRKDGKDRNTGKYVGNYFRGADGKVKPLVIDKDKSDKWKTEYTKYVIDSIADDSALLNHPLNKNGIAKDCENYSELTITEKKMVWAVLLSAMAKFESSYNPNLKFPEPGKKNKDGSQRYSGGLLQSSLSDAALYGCKYATNADVFDEKKNIECAIKIFETRLYEESDKLVYKNSSGKYVPIKTSKGAIFSTKRFNAATGDGIYWSVLNAKTGSGKDKEEFFGVQEIFKKYSEALCDPTQYVRIEADIKNGISDIDALGTPPLSDACELDKK